MKTLDTDTEVALNYQYNDLCRMIRGYQSTYSTGVDGDLAMLVVSDTYSCIVCVFVSDYGKTRRYEVPLNRLLQNVRITGNP